MRAPSAGSGREAPVLGTPGPPVRLAVGPEVRAVRWAVRRGGGSGRPGRGHTRSIRFSA
ncbi:hypothetical protein [Streptomyces rubiginosohelvolus]|uniref:hypothetical protein n=1 Tax=Streptomyces rubiginosohelvolus TaxID=67362 RepID=UPI0033B819C6